jgi:hypothetical protein
MLTRGWSVLPVHSGGFYDKRPHKCLVDTGHRRPREQQDGWLPAWQELQHVRPTAEHLQVWFSRPEGKGLGIVTGSISNLVVLDFDGEAGQATLQRLQLQPHVRTGSGGFHLYIQHPGLEVPNRRNQGNARLAEGWPGMDVRGEGGYVVAPPSRNTRGPYETLRDPADLGDFEALPEDLQKLLLDSSRRRQKSQTPRATKPSGKRGGLVALTAPASSQKR